MFAACLPAQVAPRTAVVSALNVDCASHGVRAFDNQRALLSGVKLHCNAVIAKRGGTPIEGTTIRLLSEAGRFVATAPSSADGVVSIEHHVSLPLPRDVTPVTFAMPLLDATHTGVPVAPPWMEPQTWTENPLAPGAPTGVEPRRPDPLRLDASGTPLTNNPRDNLVSWIAVVDGEETFTDANGNGAFDTGESFVDQTEPFVDANDDGTWNDGEPYLDTNKNQKWDGANGVWDAETLLWAADRVLWTGAVSRLDLQQQVVGVADQRPTFANFGSLNLRLECPPTALCSQALPPATVGFYLADPWFNSYTHSPGDSCELLPDGLPVVVTGERLRAQGVQTSWPPGERFSFIVSDIRDPLMPTPRRSPPQPFEARLACTWSNPGGTQPIQFFNFNLAQGTIE